MKRVVAALIVDDNNNKILVARRSQGQKHAGKWEFPGGKIEPGETPPESLAREILEELGMPIEVNSHFCTNIFAYQDFTIELLAYFATPLGTTIELQVHDEIRWLTPLEMQDLDFSLADVPIIKKLLEEK